MEYAVPETPSDPGGLHNVDLHRTGILIEYPERIAYLDIRQIIGVRPMVMLPAYYCPQ
jgi:hypothetical protein